MANSFDVLDNPLVRGARDVGTSFAIGSNGLLKMAGDLATLTTGKENALTRQAKENIQYLQEQKSPELLAAEADRDEAVNAEENPFHQAWTYVKKSATNPLLLATTVAETAPSSVGPGALGAGARMATGKLLARKGAEFATKVGVGTAVGAGAAMQGADVGGDQYDELVRTLEGMDDQTAMQIPQVADLVQNRGSTIPEAKAAVALQIARETGLVAGAVSVGSQFLPGGRTIEKALVGKAEKTAAPSIASRVLGAVKGAAGEATQESIEEGGGQVTKNILARPVEPEREVTAGVGPAVGQAIVGAGALGGMAGAREGVPLSRPETTSRPVSETQATAGMSGEQPTPAATKPSLKPTQEASLERSEEMTPEQFWAAVNVRQARLVGVEPNPADVAIVGEVAPPQAVFSPEIANKAIEEARVALTDWKESNPTAPENIVLIYDPELLHNGYGVQGAFNSRENTILINTAFTSPERLGQIVSHEWAHSTLSTPEGKKAFAQFAEREIPAEQLAELATRYKTEDRMVLLEEWIAENQEKAPGVISRIVARVREWLSGLGIVNLSDEEVADIMLRTLREQGENRSQPDIDRAGAPVTVSQELGTEAWNKKVGSGQPLYSLGKEKPAETPEYSSRKPYGYWIGPNGETVPVPDVGEHARSAQKFLKLPISEDEAAMTLGGRRYLHVATSGKDMYVNDSSYRRWAELPRSVREKLEDIASDRGLRIILNGEGDIEGLDFREQKDDFNDIRLSLGKEKQTPENLRKWAEGSVVVDEKGDPIPMYHGTVSRDFTTFAPNYRGLIFGSPNPEIADAFTLAFTSPILSGQKDAPENARIYKVFMRAKNPFDFENQKHVDQVFGDREYIDTGRGSPVSRFAVREGDWHDIERLADRIKKLGFDGLYVEEKGVKNLAVFDPKQVTSATGNVGAYGQRPVTAEEAARFGLSEGSANRFQERGDIRFSLSEEPERKVIRLSDRSKQRQEAADLLSQFAEENGLMHIGAGLWAGDNAQLELKPGFGREWNLAFIGTQPEDRGKGYASDLLSRITDFADKNNLPIKLIVEPTGKGKQRGLNADQLQSWYERNGFTLDEGSTDEMTRLPQGKSETKFSLTNKPVGQTALEDAKNLTFKNQTEVSKYLGDLLKKEFPEGLDKMDADSRRKLAELFDRELSLALTMPENADAIGWYNREMQKVFEILRSPELDYKLDDPVNRGIFNAILAVTSNGQKVVPQFLKTAELYEDWLKTGKIPPVGKWGGERNKAIKGHLTFLNQMIEAVGPEDTVKFLTSDQSLGDHLNNLYGMVAEAQGLPPEASVADKKAAVKKYLKTTMPSGELVDYNTVGAAVLGPKLGGGFFANLYGKFDRLTMDRWFMRTFHRLTGRLGEDRPEMIKGILDEARQEAADVLPEDLSDDEILDEIAVTGKQAFKNYKEIKKRLKADPDDADAHAQDVMRRLYNRYVKANSGLYDAPDNGRHRKFIREVIDDVQKLRAERGEEKIDTSDVQAILWYLEKDIWNRLRRKADSDEISAIDKQTDDETGDAEDTAGRVSYSDGARELYRQKTKKDYVFKDEPVARTKS